MTHQCKTEKLKLEHGKKIEMAHYSCVAGTFTDDMCASVIVVHLPVYV